MFISFSLKGSSSNTCDLETKGELTKKNGYFIENRNNQKKYWLMQTINNRIQDDFYKDNERIVEIDNQIELLKKNKTTVLAAAEKIVKYSIT